MFATYGTWVNRGHEGAGHEKPFGYWIELLWDFDAPILLMAMFGTVVVLWRRDRFGLFVASSMYLVIRWNARNHRANPHLDRLIGEVKH